MVVAPSQSAIVPLYASWNDRISILQGKMQNVKNSSNQFPNRFGGYYGLLKMISFLMVSHPLPKPQQAKWNCWFWNFPASRKTFPLCLQIFSFGWEFLLLRLGEIHSLLNQFFLLPGMSGLVLLIFLCCGRALVLLLFFSMVRPKVTQESLVPVGWYFIRTVQAISPSVGVLELTLIIRPRSIAF